MDGFQVRQSEVHGMAQRGGAVLSHLRISDETIPGDLVPKGGADMILSMEPLETLRYTDYLKTEGTAVSSKNPVINIPNYPDLDAIVAQVSDLPGAVVMDDKALAKEAENMRGMNMVMVGAASHQLPIKATTLEKAIQDLFGSKGASIVESNKKAFSLGAAAAE